MSETPKSPAQVINDLTDQVRLLRQDVAVLTATATTKKDAAALRAAVQASVKEAQDRSTKILDAAERVIDRSYQANLQAAREGAAKAVAGLQDEVRQAANRMRLETLRGSRQALYWSGGVFRRGRRPCRPGSPSGRSGAPLAPRAGRCPRLRRASGDLLRGRGRNRGDQRRWQLLLRLLDHPPLATAEMTRISGPPLPQRPG